MGKKKYKKSFQKEEQLQDILQLNNSAKQLAVRIGQAFTRQALGLPSLSEDEQYLWLAYRANLNRKTLAQAGIFLLEGAKEAAKKAGEKSAKEILEQAGDVKERRKELENKGLLGVKKKKDKDKDEFDEKEHKRDPEEDVIISPAAKYRILLDKIDCVEETGGAGDDELQWQVHGMSFWQDGSAIPVIFNSREHQDVNTGHTLSTLPPDRRKPRSASHQIANAEAVIVNRTGEQFFSVNDFLYTQFFVSLYEVDSTSTMVEFFQLLTDFLDAAASTAAAIGNPIAGLATLLANAQQQANSQETRDAADALKKLFDKLLTDSFLGEREVIITAGDVKGASYAPVPGARYQSSFEKSPLTFESHDEDDDLEFKYKVEFRFDKLKF